MRPKNLASIADLSDGKEVLISRDPMTGIATYAVFEDGLVKVRTYDENATARFEMNAKIRNETDGQRWGEGQIAASIPLSELYSPSSYIGQAWKSGDNTAVKKFLNDSDNIRYRTKNGTL